MKSIIHVFEELRTSVGVDRLAYLKIDAPNVFNSRLTLFSTSAPGPDAASHVSCGFLVWSSGSHGPSDRFFAMFNQRRSDFRE